MNNQARSRVTQSDPFAASGLVAQCGQKKARRNGPAGSCKSSGAGTNRSLTLDKGGTPHVQGCRTEKYNKFNELCQVPDRARAICSEIKIRSIRATFRAMPARYGLINLNPEEFDARLAVLTPRDWDVVRAVVFHADLTLKEVGQLIKMSHENVKNRFEVARKIVGSGTKAHFIGVWHALKSTSADGLFDSPARCFADGCHHIKQAQHRA